MTKCENDLYRFLAVGDCTGHGVPGALMSVLGLNLLTEIVENKHVEGPAEILNELRNGILRAFDKEENSGAYKDGMDISLVRISKNRSTVTYAAANNPVYHLNENGLSELAADRQAVGYSFDMKPFSEHTVNFSPGDALVLFTDGVADQFGGPKGKKFMYRPFKELVVRNRHNDFVAVLRQTFDNWKGELEQVDDVCVALIRL